ncbi:MAG: GntR family transcriptional regulator [Limnobacter sp.]|nr:GntR family transcriptional regulator [Limnobacter sp.]
MNPTFSPLYQQIKALLLEALQNGEWKPGEMIPAETELAVRFGVSQGTVRKAIDELAADNLVVRRQGRGTFVATHNEAKAQYRFLRLEPDGEQVAGHPSSTYIKLEKIRATAQVAKLLAIKTSETIFLVQRVLSFAGKPVVFDEIYLPASQYKGLDLQSLVDWQGSLYGFLETRFGVRMLRATEKIKAVQAQARHCEHLGIAESEPLLHVERLSRTYSDKPVELRKGWYLTDGFVYRNELY